MLYEDTIPPARRGKLAFLEVNTMQKVQFEIRKSLEELQRSPYHQQLGRKVCAAFIAQQQGIKLDTAFKKIEEPMGDLWLVMAEVIRQQWSQAADGQLSVLANADRDQTVQ
jgi:hypothetical protein